MKGQLSLDLMIAIVMTLILIQALSAFGENFLFNQEKTSIKLQAKHIISDLGKALKYAHTLEENDDYTIKYVIPWISLSSSQGDGGPAVTSCDITVNPENDIIILSIGHADYNKLLENETITETTPYIVGVHSFNANCGSTLEIKKTDGS
ncbi:MAG: hypothetical protein Q7K34_02090 [archaeon]|nr:hypothetical protein [archaeon]